MHLHFTNYTHPLSLATLLPDIRKPIVVAATSPSHLMLDQIGMSSWQLFHDEVSHGS